MRDSFPYETEMTPEVVNMHPGRLARMLALFEKQQQRGDFPGGQLAVRRNGKVVINRACGLARGYKEQEAGEPVRMEINSYFPAHSCGKPGAAIAIALLEERNKLDLDIPLIDILPELGKYNGPEITLNNVLTHTAGLVFPGLYDFIDQFDEERIWQYIINTRPRYKPGTYAYMPTEFGWILSQVVKRVDGRSIVQFIHDEIAAPLQLPSLRYGLDGRDIDSLAYQYWLGKQKVMVTGSNVAPIFEAMVNSKAYYESHNPAICLVTDAASLAGFYEFLVRRGVSHSGVRLLKEETVLKYTQKSLYKWNRSMNAYISMGRGFMTGMKWVPTLYGWYGTQSCFGHGGAFSSAAFGDMQTGLSVAILTNGNRSIFDVSKRLIPLLHGLRKACF